MGQWKSMRTAPTKGLFLVKLVITAKKYNIRGRPELVLDELGRVFSAVGWQAVPKRRRKKRK